jgi:hypothetical protein
MIVSVIFWFVSTLWWTNQTNNEWQTQVSANGENTWIGGSSEGWSAGEVTP